MRTDAADAAELNHRGQVQSFLYDAFISYDHDDRAGAYGVQRGLHRIGRRVGRLHALRVCRSQCRSNVYQRRSVGLSERPKPA